MNQSRKIPTPRTSVAPPAAMRPALIPQGGLHVVSRDEIDDAADGITSTTPDERLGFDMIVLSHLRWNFVYQRPQHLLERCARRRRVFFIEEPVETTGPARMEMTMPLPHVWVASPNIPAGLTSAAREDIQRALLDELIADYAVSSYALWYYTPMAMAFTGHLTPLATVYDCMDELSAFRGAPPALRAHEAALFARADLVFTGGQSLYEAKRTQHPRVHPFPSSVDVSHFAQARGAAADPADQAGIPHPRLGFFGVIDERMDRDLVAGIADARPDWQLVIIGPVAKLEPSELPRRRNIHYLGQKQYWDLPAYLGGWDVALMPFARNEATRFISPTKTPEYLAAGKPVVSTAIRDVVRPYGERCLVRIADTVTSFVAAITAALEEDPTERVRRADAFLARQSWDDTWVRMEELVVGVVERGADTRGARRDSALGGAALGHHTIGQYTSGGNGDV